MEPLGCPTPQPGFFFARARSVHLPLQRGFWMRMVNSLRAPSGDASGKENRHIRQQALTRT